MRVIFVTTHVVGVPLTRLSAPTARMQSGRTALISSAIGGQLFVSPDAVTDVHVDTDA